MKDYAKELKELILTTIKEGALTCISPWADIRQSEFLGR